MKKRSGSNLPDQNNMVEPTAAMCIWTAASKRRHLCRALHEKFTGVSMELRTYILTMRETHHKPMNDAHHKKE